jgi:hypothetical protein
MQPAYIMTQDGNMTLVVNGKSFTVGKSHPNHSRILDALKQKRYENLEAMLDVPKAITQQMGGKVTVSNGKVFYNGLPMHNTVTERIMNFLSEGLPVDPLVSFLENLMANPMPMAVAELYEFLENTDNGRPQFPITEDGCFIGYKGVREDWMDKHSGTVSNTIGSVIEMPRENVDPDRRNECSYGYHVGTLAYATQFVGEGGRILMVKVNPADCIAVPKDHNCSKLRVCKYEVLQQTEGIIQTPMYPMPSVIHDEGPEPEELDDLQDELDNDYEEFDDEPENETTGTFSTDTPVQTKVVMPKRAPCAYCGAKGGKRHDPRCKRP